jgi:hypothetical protein
MVLALVVATLIGTLLGLVPVRSANADVLLIEEVRQSERMQLPVNGMSKADVRGRFGEPADTRAPVGDPPITRWDYEGWSVYFEYDLVLFTVLQKGQVLDQPKKG